MTTAITIQPHYDDDPDSPDRRNALAVCHRCQSELENGITETGEPITPQSHEQYARQQFGATADGWQVWCVRHDCNIVAITPRIAEQKES